MHITTVLFDADGVIQWPGADRRAMWASLLGGRHELVDDFFEALLTLERTCYCGDRDFVAALPSLLREWRCSGTLGDLLSAWTAIEVDPDVVRLISALRSEGVTCCLATNQEPFRGRYMAETLGYGTLFDREFYSCGLGFCKPDPNYFMALLERLGRSQDETLFLDDKEANTTAAASVGIRSELFVPPHGTPPVDEMRRILRRNGLPLSG